jgi:hypothetical protein
LVLNKISFLPRPTTLGLLQLGLDVEAIIGCAYPGFGFGGRNSAGLLLVNFGF